MYPCQVPCPTGEFNERDCQGPGSNETNSFFLHTNLVLLMIDLRHLRTVHALRETDSLHEAAERLHLTQSAFCPVPGAGGAHWRATVRGNSSDMLEVPYVSDFLLTAKDTSFATLEGVNAFSGLGV